MSDDDEISKLMTGLLDGGLTPSELARALRLAAEDETAGKRLVDLLALRSALPAIIAEAAETAKPDCVRTRAIFAAYLDGTAEPADVGFLSRHLDDCLPCALAFDVDRAKADGTDLDGDLEDDLDDEDFDDDEIDAFIEAERSAAEAAAEHRKAQAEAKAKRRRLVALGLATLLALVTLAAGFAFATRSGGREPSRPAGPAFEPWPSVGEWLRIVDSLGADATPRQTAELRAAAGPKAALDLLSAQRKAGGEATAGAVWALAAAHPDPVFRRRIYAAGLVAPARLPARAEEAVVRELKAGDLATATAASEALRGVEKAPSPELRDAFVALLRRATDGRVGRAGRLVVTLGRYCAGDADAAAALAAAAEGAVDSDVGAAAAYLAAEAAFDRHDAVRLQAALAEADRFLRSANEAAVVIAWAAVRCFADSETVHRRRYELARNGRFFETSAFAADGRL